MNKSVITGELREDPKFDSTKSGRDLCTFTLIAKSAVKIHREGRVEITRRIDYVPCIAWGPVAHIVKDYLRRGSRICVEGKLCSRKHYYAPDDPNSEYIEVMELAIDEIEFIDGINKRD